MDTHKRKRWDILQYLFFTFNYRSVSSHHMSYLVWKIYAYFSQRGADLIGL